MHLRRNGATIASLQKHAPGQFVRRGRLASCLIALSLLCATHATAQPDSTAAPPAASSSAGKSAASVLKGGVEHAEALPRLGDDLRAGRVFSDDMLLKGGTATNNAWFLIPNWFAGVRHTEDELIVYRYDYATGQASAPMQKQLNRQESMSGYQMDKNGAIWDFKHVPAIQHVESFPFDGIFYIKAITPLTNDGVHLVIKYELIDVSVNKKTRKIVRVRQQEQINNYTSPQPGILRTEVSAKSFDRDGKPERIEQSVIISNVIKPFQRIDDFEGQSLRPLFRDYLMSHDLDNLVPDDLR